MQLQSKIAQQDSVTAPRLQSKASGGMVFIEDSERAANNAQAQGFDTGPTTWEILRKEYQMSNGPFVPGGLLVGCGRRPVPHWRGATDCKDAITPNYPS